MKRIPMRFIPPARRLLRIIFCTACSSCRGSERRCRIVRYLPAVIHQRAARICRFYLIGVVRCRPFVRRSDAAASVYGLTGIGSSILVVIPLAGAALSVSAGCIIRCPACKDISGAVKEMIDRACVHNSGTSEALVKFAADRFQFFHVLFKLLHTAVQGNAVRSHDLVSGKQDPVRPVKQCRSAGCMIRYLQNFQRAVSEIKGISVAYDNYRIIAGEIDSRKAGIRNGCQCRCISGHIGTVKIVCLQDGRPCETRIIEEAFQHLKEDAGLPNVVFHSLRHSSTTYKLKLNHGDLKATQGDTGHAELDMITNVYAHILDEDRKVNAQKFEASFYADPNLHAPALHKNIPVPEETPAPATLDIAVLIDQLRQNPDLAATLAKLVLEQKTVRP